MTIPDAEQGPNGARPALESGGDAPLALESGRDAPLALESGDARPEPGPAGDDFFELGEVVLSPGVLALAQLGTIYVALLLRRHATGDWGDVGADGVWANTTALAEGGRLVSVYGRIRVITRADRSVTTILLPGEA